METAVLKGYLKLLSSYAIFILCVLNTSSKCRFAAVAAVWRACVLCIHISHLLSGFVTILRKGLGFGNSVPPAWYIFLELV